MLVSGIYEVFELVTPYKDVVWPGLGVANLYATRKPWRITLSQLWKAAGRAGKSQMLNPMLGYQKHQQQLKGQRPSYHWQAKQYQRIRQLMPILRRHFMRKTCQNLPTIWSKQRKHFPEPGET